MSKNKNIRISLVAYDVLIGIVSVLLILYQYLHIQGHSFTMKDVIVHGLIFIAITILFRFVTKIYKQIWRYGGVQCYLKLMLSDCAAFIVFYVVERFFFSHMITFAVALALSAINLLIALGIRLAYRYCFKYSDQLTERGKFLGALLTVGSFGKVQAHHSGQATKVSVAILGAGNLGVSLAEELKASAASRYAPRIFIDSDPEKANKEIHDMNVYYEDDVDHDLLAHHEIQEIIFAIPNLPLEKKRDLYFKYNSMGVKVKSYDYNSIKAEGGKAQVKDFDIEELLFRKPIVVVDEFTKKYFEHKVVMITGGGGSIGSEMCRQVAKMNPKKIVLVDIAENGVYDVNVELKFAYGKNLHLDIEIADVTDKKTLQKVFGIYKPQVVIHCAAHKHVPLMEHNCVESIRNNVFGTLNTVEVAEEYGVERFIMVSTDKAVNPVNVMGATKRVCEMIVNAHANSGTKTTFNTTRFGNVLGSAGSVVPIFKKELASGGPLTVTDFRIIRYFMTIPEASQLVLKSAAMAKNGELFVLDMGKPVKILDLAESMIKLSGMVPYKDIDIVEVGLRPGEKLYEELLIQPDKLDKTDDELIFIEHDTAISMDELNNKLDLLRKAVDEADDEKAKEVLKSVVPTFRNPEDVNEEAIARDWERIVVGQYNKESTVQ